MEFKDNLEKAKNMLINSEVDENLFNRIYSFTTENISGYIDYFDFKNKSLLTVGSSGDQILNSYFNGARDITLLDINSYAPYYIYLKIAGILSFTYQEFQEFFFIKFDDKLNNNRFNMNLFNKLISNLKAIDYDSYYFFDYIFKNYSKDKICEFLFIDDEVDSKVIKRINNYLVYETRYNMLKRIIKDINFKFIHQDIFKYDDSNTKFDNIFLSNLCTLQGLNLYDYRDLLFKLKANNLTINGSMLFVYIWNMQYDSDEVNFDWKQVYNMPSTRHLLEKFITEHYNITGVSDIRFNMDRKSDLVLIYRNK